MCEKFTVDRFNRFSTGAHFVFTNEKSFINEISLTMTIATVSTIQTHSLIKLPSVKFHFESYISFPVTNTKNTFYLNFSQLARS